MCVTCLTVSRDAVHGGAEASKEGAIAGVALSRQRVQKFGLSRNLGGVLRGGAVMGCPTTVE